MGIEIQKYWEDYRLPMPKLSTGLYSILEEPIYIEARHQQYFFWTAKEIARGGPQLICTLYYNGKEEY